MLFIFVMDAAMATLNGALAFAFAFGLDGSS